MTDERAVSDLIAFVMIFTVMIASVGVIAVFGWDALGAVRDAEQLDGAEYSFVTLNDQLNGIADHEAPARATEMRLGEATLSVADGPRLTVKVEENATNTTTIEADLGALRFDLGDRHVTTAGGAVFRGDDGGSVMVSDPPMHCGEGGSRINLIELRAEEVSSVDSVATVQVQIRHQRTSLRIPSRWDFRNTTRQVTLSVDDAPNRSAWERYLERSGWDPVEEQSGTFVCSSESTTMPIIVRSTRVNLEFVR